MPKTKNGDSKKLFWYMGSCLVSSLLIVAGWSIDHLYSNLKEGQAEIKTSVKDGQKEIKDSVKENFREISALSARVAKLEP